MLTWRKTSDYSIGAQGTDYAVSRSVVLDQATGELCDSFTAWHGPLLRDQPRESTRMPDMLGVRRTPAEAKALCEAHASSTLPLAGDRAANERPFAIGRGGEGAEGQGGPP